jgi:hypothetical protein
MSTFQTVQPEQEPATSHAALKESADFTSGKLERDESIRTHIHVAGLLVFWVFVSVVLAMFIVLSWHLAAPEKWRFLNSEQRDDLQMVLLSSVGSSFATVLSRRWLNPKL